MRCWICCYHVKERMIARAGTDDDMCELEATRQGTEPCMVRNTIVHVRTGAEMAKNGSMLEKERIMTC